MKTKPCRHCGEEVPASMSSCPSCGGTHAVDPALAFSVWLDDVLLRLRPHWKKILIALPFVVLTAIHGYTLLRYSTVNIHRAAACAVYERGSGENLAIVLHSHNAGAVMAEYMVHQFTPVMKNEGLWSSYRVVLGGGHALDVILQMGLKNN